jgi:hypothetical protein
VRPARGQTVEGNEFVIVFQRADAPSAGALAESTSTP